MVWSTHALQKPHGDCHNNHFTDTWKQRGINSKTFFYIINTVENRNSQNKSIENSLFLSCRLSTTRAPTTKARLTIIQKRERGSPRIYQRDWRGSLIFADKVWISRMHWIVNFKKSEKSSFSKTIFYYLYTYASVFRNIYLSRSTTYLLNVYVRDK